MDQKALDQALARFEGFRTNQPHTISESQVREYHNIVDAIGLATGELQLDVFKIGDNELEHKVIGSQRISFSGRPGHVIRSPDKRCDSNRFQSQIDALSHYLDSQGYRRGSTWTRGEPRHGVHIDPLYGVAIQQGVRGSPTDADYEFARLAIEEARKSVPESDGRPHPKVGAVVVKDGKVLSAAHRGEVPGNHAEFIALERNLSDAAVAGATVYTTLEPCTTRNRPKIPCADRLIERKVARVVIGILDPDERIRGKGQRKLSNAGIATALFPHDLAMEVEELNREFTRFCEKQSPPQTHPAKSFAPAGGLKPLVVPLRYGPSPPSAGKNSIGHHGLIVANHGEPAYDVSVSTPKIQIGTSELRFEGSKPVFTKADGDAFFIGTIELAPHHGTLGSGLFEEMRKFQVDEVTVKLIYKDAENHWYETIGKIERDVSVSGGLSVRYVRQERTKQP